MLTILRYVMVFVVLTACPVRAEDVTNIRENKIALKHTKEELAEEEARKEALTSKIEEVFGELAETKENLIVTAAQIRENESNLQDLEERISRLEENKSIIERKLNEDRGAISRLVLALERIRRSPPEAMLARPESPYKTAQSALLMSQLIPSLERHTQALQKNLKTLENVSLDLKNEQNNHLSLSQSLQAQHETLSALMAAREDIYLQTNQDIQAREASIQQISLRAKNLEDLVDRLKEAEAQDRARIEAERSASPDADEQEIAALTDRLRMQSVLVKPKGQTQLPVSGTISIKYNEKDSLGASSNGLTIESRSGAIVVAPLAGIVQFAGPFKKYGNIVIIEHEDGYHSLVAGLKKIDTLVGERVESGEPIGLLPDTATSGEAPRLYYELRKNGKPVNPSVKFAELG